MAIALLPLLTGFVNSAAGATTPDSLACDQVRVVQDAGEATYVLVIRNAGRNNGPTPIKFTLHAGESKIIELAEGRPFPLFRDNAIEMGVNAATPSNPTDFHERPPLRFRFQTGPNLIMKPIATDVAGTAHEQPDAAPSYARLYGARTLIGPHSNRDVEFIRIPCEPLQVCLKNLVYAPVYLADKSSFARLCLFLAVIKNEGNACAGLKTVTVPVGKELNWVQTYKTNYDPKTDASCVAGVAHKDPCESATKERPLYRPDEANRIFEKDGGSPDFPSWQQTFGDKAGMGKIVMLFRDIPGRHHPSNLTIVNWSTWIDPQPKNQTDNDLRMVSYEPGDEASYTPLIHIKYGFHIDFGSKTIALDPLLIDYKQSATFTSQTFDEVVLRQSSLPQACMQTEFGGMLGSADPLAAH
jgi:hypothetical protein